VYPDGYVCSLDSSTHPNPSNFYTITCDLAPNQLPWLLNDSCIDAEMVTFGGTYYLDDSTLEVCCESGCSDLDDDGYGEPANSSCTYPELDCDDSDSNVNPNVEESLAGGNCTDGKDNDCDGSTDGDDPACQPPCTDNDNDGYDDESCGGDDCNDSSSFIYPSNPNTTCDCAEPDPQGVTEIECNGIDEDCNGADLCGGPCSGGAAVAE
jgi:hypothetical protein